MERLAGIFVLAVLWMGLIALSYLSDIKKEIETVRLMLQTDSDHKAISAVSSIPELLVGLGEILAREGVLIREVRKPVP
jgi:hypothetical protein